MNSGKMYSIASIFFGVISIAVCMIFFISFPAAVLAIFFGIMAVKKYYRKSGSVSIIMGSIGIILTIIIFINIVQKLNVDSLIAGKWNTDDGQRIEFTDRGTYKWYLNREVPEEYSSGYYELSPGVYRNGRRYTLGYTIKLKQLTTTTQNSLLNDKQFINYLIYTPGKEVLDGKSTEYEMMNLQTGIIIKIMKVKEKLFGIFSI